MLVMNVCEGACARTGNLEGMCGRDVCGRDEVVGYGRGHAGGCWRNKDKVASLVGL